MMAQSPRPTAPAVDFSVTRSSTEKIPPIPTRTAPAVDLTMSRGLTAGTSQRSPQTVSVVASSANRTQPL